MYIALNLWLWVDDELFSDKSNDPVDSLLNLLSNHLSLIEILEKIKFILLITLKMNQLFKKISEILLKIFGFNILYLITL